MIKTQSESIPDNWKKDCPESISRWFDNLPIVKDLPTIEAIDQQYELLKLKE